MSQGAAATRGQRAGRQLSEAALALRLTSTRSARAGRSQRGCSLTSSLSRQIVIGVHKWVKPRHNSLARGKRQQGPEPGRQTSPMTQSQKSDLSPAACEGMWACWEVAAPGNPPLPALSSLLSHPSVTKPSHQQPRGLCGAFWAQDTNAGGSREKQSHLASKPTA